MDELEKLRLEIDAIDTEIIKLYEKRMDVVKSVLNYKVKNSIPVLDKNREGSMLEKISIKLKKKNIKNIMRMY